MSDAKKTTLQLILWPSILTLLVNVGRVVGQKQGWITTASGGGFAWFGITWLGFLFGAWFAYRLRRSGSTPRRAFWWPLLSLLAVLGVAVWQFSGIDRADTSEAAMEPLRNAVLSVTAIALAMALVQFAVWPRLAWTLLAYAVPARLTVLALTWLAKSQGWDSHYTKFGPAGIEREMAETMQSAAVAQLGFWVPLTIIVGTLVGCLLAGRPAKKPS